MKTCVKEEHSDVYDTFIEELVAYVLMEDESRGKFHQEKELYRIELVGLFCRSFIYKMVTGQNIDLKYIGIQEADAHKMMQKATILSSAVKNNYGWHREPLSVLGEVNYILTKIICGVIENESYGVTSAVKANVMRIRDELISWIPPQKQPHVDDRKVILIRGVIDDVVDKFRDRVTSSFYIEDESKGSLRSG